jgi:hypothetical protein
MIAAKQLRHVSPSISRSLSRLRAGRHRANRAYEYALLLHSLVTIFVFVGCLIGMVVTEEVSAQSPPIQGPPSPNKPSYSAEPSPPTTGSDTIFKGLRDWQSDKLNWGSGAGRSYVPQWEKSSCTLRWACRSPLAFLTVPLAGRCE